MFSRILIAGFGNIAKRHKDSIQRLLPNADIAVLSARSSTVLKEPNSVILSSILDAQNFSPELVVVCTPSSSHISVARAFAKQGSHLFIEKPISDLNMGIVELIEECNARNCFLMVGYNLRYLESLQTFRRFIYEGLIGEPLSVRCEVGQYLPNWRPNRDYRESATARREKGGGVLLELSHEIDYLRWIFGEAKWVRATLLRQSKLEIDVEDTVHMLIGFENLGSERELVANVNMDFIRHDTTRCCTVIGSKGSLKWDGVSGKVLLFEEGEKEWRTLFTDDNGVDTTYVLEWQDFFEAVKGKTIVGATGVDGLRVIEIIEAARVSSQNGIETAVAKAKLNNEGRT